MRYAILFISCCIHAESLNRRPVSWSLWNQQGATRTLYRSSQDQQQKWYVLILILTLSFGAYPPFLM